MKFYNITDVDGFLKCIDQCKGKVLMVSEEGDRLNLKSQLSRAILYSDIFAEGKICEMEILCSEPEDMRRLYAYIGGGKEA